MTHWELTSRRFGGLASLGATPSRAEEYYRTGFPTSSPKFRWLNGKGIWSVKNGTEIVQFLEILNVTSSVPNRLEAAAESCRGIDARS
jgi:hypothetical protein